MPAQKTVFATVVDSIGTKDQKISIEGTNVTVSRVSGGVESPIVTLHSAKNGNAVIIENAFGSSQPINSVPMIKQNLQRMGIALNKTTEGAPIAHEVAGPTEVKHKAPKEFNVD